MPELYLHALRTDDAGIEESAATRERLKEIFPKLASRRMTQLGLVIGGTLLPHDPTIDDVLVYASEYAETRALEGYLESFPAASPTLFQTSIHPSAPQQSLIGRQQPIREYFPITGCAGLVLSALETAWLAKAPRTLLCGGEERGTWLRERGTASARTFGFTAVLTHEPTGALATLSWGRGDAASAAPGPAADGLLLPAFFDALHRRETLSAEVAPGCVLNLVWS